MRFTTENTKDTEMRVGEGERRGGGDGKSGRAGEQVMRCVYEPDARARVLSSLCFFFLFLFTSSLPNYRRPQDRLFLLQHPASNLTRQKRRSSMVTALSGKP